jgi:hypothetical protein
MREMWDSDNLGGDLSDLGAPRRKDHTKQPGPNMRQGGHPRTKVMVMGHYFGYLGAAKTAAEKAKEAEAKKIAAAQKKDDAQQKKTDAAIQKAQVAAQKAATTGSAQDVKKAQQAAQVAQKAIQTNTKVEATVQKQIATAAQQSAAKVVQAQKKDEAKLAQQQKQADAKLAQQQKQTAAKQAQAEKQQKAKDAQALKKSAAEVKKADKQKAAATKKEERAQDKKAKLEAKKALKLKNGKTVNIPESEVPKVQAIEKAGEKLKADLPKAIETLNAKKAKIADLKKQIADKKAAKPAAKPGITSQQKKPVPGTGLAVKKPVAVAGAKKIAPKSILTKKGLGWLAYLGAAPAIYPAGSTVDVTPVKPKGYDQRKYKGNLKVQDQVYELSIYSQQQLGAFAAQMDAMQAQFDTVMQQIADSEAEIQGLMEQLNSINTGGTGIDPNTGYPYGIDPATGLPYQTGIVDQGLVDQGLTTGGTDDGYPTPDISQPINEEDTGGYTGTGLETSPVDTGSGAIDEMISPYGGEEGVSQIQAESGAIGPAPGYQQAMPDYGGGYTDESGLLESGAGQESMDYGSETGEILSPTQTMVPPMPPSPVVEPTVMTPVPVQQADQEVMFPTPVTGDEVSGAEVYQEASAQEELMPDSGAEETFDTAPVMAPAMMTDDGEEEPLAEIRNPRRKGGRGSPIVGDEGDVSDLAPVGDEEGFSF